MHIFKPWGNIFMVGNISINYSVSLNALMSTLTFFGEMGYLKSCNLKTDFLVDDSLEPSVAGRYCRLTSLARVEVQRLLNN